MRTFDTGAAEGNVCLIALCILTFGCSEQPVQGLQVTGASPIRRTQIFETQLVSGTAERCIIRTK